ncbi:MAG: lysylphosphatidylglycerol synthase transmembrane domain-containing protein [Chryseolinea sp.]
MNWKLLIKIALTSLALYWVYRQVNLKDIGQYIFKAPAAITLASVLLYNVAKLLGAYRLNLFFKQESILISTKDNLKLYYIGMFYNLFLPGGVGGDGYKGYCIHESFDVSLKKVFKPILWDRVSGAVAILFLSMFIALFFPEITGETIWMLIVIGCVLLYPCFWIATAFIVSRYKKIFVATTAWALSIQILQGIVTVLLLVGMGVSFDDLGKYLFIYFVSTLATTLPITLGAIGIREVIFIEAAKIGLVDQNTAVAFSLLFFAVGAISSLPGAFIRVDLSRPALEPNS